MDATENEPLLNKKSKSNDCCSFPSSSVKRPRVGFFERRRRQKALKQYVERQAHLEELYRRDDAVIEAFEMGQGVHKKVRVLQRMSLQSEERGTDKCLAHLAFSLNVVLLLVNLLASILSGSLSILSTFVDSLMDVSSSVILNVCLFLIDNTNHFNYPRGRERLELIGVILCSIIMGIANMVMILQAVESVLSDTVNPEVNFLTAGILLSGSSIKVIFMIVCYRQNSPSSKVLAMDMRNDIATSLVALSCAVIGDRLWKYADPLGAIIVCGLIATSWFGHALEHIPKLVGIRAEQEELSRILRVAIEHDERIICIDHVMVYHTGNEALVELHIVMDENLPLKVTHDITHPLEIKLRQLDFVERAFVHCDYTCDGD